MHYPQPSLTLLDVRSSSIFSDMSAIQNTAESIRKRIESLPVGVPFLPSAFLDCGTRATVDQTLSRLVKSGMIMRVSRGVLVRPEVSRHVGKVMPEPIKIAQAIAKTTGDIVQVHGAEAARRLDLSTQVPTQPVFYTSGPSKRIHMGEMEIRLQHVCPRKLALAGRPAGLALSALWYLGKAEVTVATIEKIRAKLPPDEFDALKAAASVMPAWMSDTLFRQEQASVDV